MTMAGRIMVIVSLAMALWCLWRLRPWGSEDPRGAWLQWLLIISAVLFDLGLLLSSYGVDIGDASILVILFIQDVAFGWRLWWVETLRKRQLREENDRVDG